MASQVEYGPASSGQLRPDSWPIPTDLAFFTTERISWIWFQNRDSRWPHNGESLPGGRLSHSRFCCHDGEALPSITDA